jgi:hypothetical protein
MTSKQWTLIGVLGFVAFFLILTARLMGMLPAIVFTVALGGGLALWLATTYKIQVDPLKLIVPYLLTMIFGLNVTLREIRNASSPPGSNRLSR